MGENDNRILNKMLERLFSALVSGPSLNCRPHSSRQRVDLMQLARLKDISPEDSLRQLLGEAGATKVIACVPQPPKRVAPAQGEEEQEELTPEQRAAQQAWSEQQTLLSKLRAVAEDAKTYENDTGVHILHLGFPLLSLPPGAGGLKRALTRRILAPLAFISVTLNIKGGSSPSVTLDCKNQGVDMVVPNVAFLSWLEQQTGQRAAELFEDETGEKPWEEIASITQRICQLLGMAIPASFSDFGTMAAGLKLAPAPRSEEVESTPTIYSSAVLGLFPMANQGLLRDTQAMIDGEEHDGPVRSFIEVDASLVHEHEAAQPVDGPRQPRIFKEERLVSSADPCQARAVKLARRSRGLVVHGPPGTGKSQTIANIIGDHLARGQRVLMVCDKRTALDVVMNRLDGLGLGGLCAIIHDPQRDQRDLYKAIRQQVDDLADAQTYPKAERQLPRVDAELQKLHAQLMDCHVALMEPPEGQSHSFHELMGQWLQISAAPVDLGEDALKDTTSDLLELHARDLAEIFNRAEKVSYPQNPWVDAAGIRLADLLATPMDRVRASMAGCVQLAQEADATADIAIPPFGPSGDLPSQGQARQQLARQLTELLATVDRQILLRWSKADARAIKNARQKLIDANVFVDILRAGPLDGELAAITRGNLPGLATIGLQLVSLDRYLQAMTKWYAFLMFGAKSEATKVLAGYGQTASPGNAQRVKQFLMGLRARLVLQALVAEIMGTAPVAGLPADDVLDAALVGHSGTLELLSCVHGDPALSPLAKLVGQVLASPTESSAILTGLEKSLPRAMALARLETAVNQTRLFNITWLNKMTAAWRAGEPATELNTRLLDSVPTIEGVLRIQESLAGLPAGLRTASASLIIHGVDAVAGMQSLGKGVLAAEISQRLKNDPILQEVDGQRLKATFDRYRELELQKRGLVRDVILNTWVTRQRDRLLASTGSRLNSVGAEVRRRLTLRGERAMRLRQVIGLGQQDEGGDPLFDLRPVWMASPETVAQIFPRKSLFDVVIFDEASQCRLEEALPVLLRGQRVVIAGDPQQLPPTRFFEGALATSENEQIESDQQLFEVQQSDIEDLLGAALNIEIEESYLDVHYRSRNADLIEFSNQHFYSSRLQAIPGHPANRTRFAPLTLYKAGGVYDDRCNQAEADRVCRIVGDLLKRAEPPTIGIACFNIQQRDLIIDKLDALAEQDPEFARRLAEARTRRRDGALAGLFVKNLENVQGDERDHIIISTTYGPDKTGKFYRRFGPLGQAGGGRRLNVLVTRAREEVHLVTSIPEMVYRAMPPVPPGQAPGGAWLLFSYLSFAETLASAYEQARQVLDDAQTAQKATVNVRTSKWPSLFSEALARQLGTRHNIGSDVHWGNDGFCIDLALHHPTRLEDVTVGVLCDLNRFHQAQDPIEWEAFRTMVLESQGWRLHRIWTPQFFRDVAGSTKAIIQEAQEVVADQENKDAIRVEPG